MKAISDFELAVAVAPHLAPAPARAPTGAGALAPALAGVRAPTGALHLPHICVSIM